MAPAVPQPLLELHSTSVIIDGSVVVDRVSLTVGRGEFVLLRGPTGSGKSTVLKLLAGLVRPTSGEVIVAGDRVDHFNEMERRWLRRSMGLMMQDGRLLDDRTVHENVMLPALAAEESYAEARRRGFLALENAVSPNTPTPSLPVCLRVSGSLRSSHVRSSIAPSSSLPTNLLHIWTMLMVKRCLHF